jgi:hypothetical protein
MMVQRLFTAPALPYLFLAFTLNISCAPAQTTPAPPPSKPPVRVRPNLQDFDISPKAGQSANQGAAVSRGDSAPKLYAPALGKTYTITPQFRWQALDSEAKVTFHLMTADGKTVYEAVASGGQFNYPASAPALTPGTTYRWTVIPADDDLYAGLPVPVGFLVVSGTERDAITAELTSHKDPSAKAEVYLNHRLWYDAIQAYSDLLDRNPNDTNARTTRAQIYSQFPVTQALADADWEKVH